MRGFLNVFMSGCARETMIACIDCIKRSTAKSCRVAYLSRNAVDEGLRKSDGLVAGIHVDHDALTVSPAHRGVSQ